MAALAAAVLVALAPVLIAKMSGKSADPPKPGGTATASPLPSIVDRGTDLAERYIHSLEDRADRAETQINELRDELEAERRRSAENQLRMQRDLDAANAEITSLRGQIQMLTWQGRGRDGLG